MNKIRAFADDIWFADQSYSLLGADIGTRMTIIRTASGLLIHSPIKLESQILEEVKQLGTPAYIVAPSCMHNLNIRAWSQTFPEAHVYAPSTANLEGNMPFNKLHASQEFPWEEEIVTLEVGGMPKIKESVFFHKATQTLVVSDLFFNLVEPMSGWTRLLAKLYGIYGRVSTTRLFRIYIKDNLEFHNFVISLSSYYIDKLIVSHGQNIESGACEVIFQELNSILDTMRLNA